MSINYDKYLYSTGTHYISNSGKDENNGTKGGKAGDQTGHEFEVKKWYSRPWTVVLRYPDQAVADTKIEELTRKVEKHNNMIERTYQLEGRMTEVEHDIRDIKGRVA